LAKRIEVLIEGVADTGGFIADIATEAVSENLTPGGIFALGDTRSRSPGRALSAGFIL
jgi:hypothetical protein